MTPSDYFRRNCWISVEADEEHGARTSSTRSATSSWSFSTDYPHGDSKFPHAVDAFDKLPMTDDAKAATVSTNWSELYKIPLVKQV